MTGAAIMSESKSQTGAPEARVFVESRVLRPTEVPGTAPGFFRAKPVAKSD
jgi:hypothetical protein